MRLLERKAQISENEASTTASTSSSRNPHVPTFKFTPFNEKVDDLDTWFSLFERQCDIYNVKGKDRKPHLMSLISGQCRQVFLSLDVEADYKTIKDALLSHFNLTKDEFRKKFFCISPNAEETITSYCQRLNVCFDKWVDLTGITKDYESLRDLIISHRIFESCNPNLISFLIERDCYKVKDVEQTARRFFLAHNSENLSKSMPFPFSSNYAGEQQMRGRNMFSDQSKLPFYRSKSQDRYKYNYHKNKSDRKHEDSRNRNNGNDQQTSQDVRNKPLNDQPKVLNSKIQCYLCLGFGHIKQFCPSKPLSVKCTAVHKPNLTDETVFSINKSDSTDILNDKSYFSLPDSLYMQANSAREMKDKHVYPGLIEFNNSLHDINVLRDTGSMIHAVHKKFVQPENYLDQSITLITFGGKTEIFQLASVFVDTPFLKGKITACVLDNYPPDYMYYDVLIGNGGTLGSPIASDPNHKVVEIWKNSHRNRHINEIESPSVEDFNKFSTNQVQTRAQKLNENKTKNSLNDQVLDFDISYADLAKLQREDVTLSKYFDLVDTKPKNTKLGSCSFEIRNGILVRLYTTDCYSFVQVMVPVSLRARILSSGHGILSSSQKNINRTFDRITSSFYWPGVKSDVKKFCKSFKLCSNTKSKRRKLRVPTSLSTTIVSEKPCYKEVNDIKFDNIESNFMTLPEFDKIIKTIIVNATRLVKSVGFIVLLLLLLVLPQGCDNQLNSEFKCSFPAGNMHRPTYLVLNSYVDLNEKTMTYTEFVSNKFYLIPKQIEPDIIDFHFSKWKGSHSDIDYVIDIQGKHKTYHINMLQEYPVRPTKLIPDLLNINPLHCNNYVLIDDTQKCKPVRIVWMDECQNALTDLQTRLNTQFELILPDLSQKFYVQTDASGVGIGGVLLQRREDLLQPCLFVSRKLLPQETRYSVIERECLALVWVLGKFSRYLLGRQFTLMTDHRPLLHMDKEKSVNSRICRWSLLLQEFQFGIEFIKGRDNIVADGLSRGLYQ